MSAYSEALRKRRGETFSERFNKKVKALSPQEKKPKGGVRILGRFFPYGEEVPEWYRKGSQHLEDKRQEWLRKDWEI